jgi:hypothetical protein
MRMSPAPRKRQTTCGKEGRGLATAPYPTLLTKSSLARLDPASGRHLQRMPGVKIGRSRTTAAINRDGPPLAQAPRTQGGSESPAAAILIHLTGCVRGEL